MIRTFHVSSKARSNRQFFDQIRFSNIGDYTGYLAVLTHATPVLKREITCKQSDDVVQHGGQISSNVLLNTGMWKTFEHYLYHHSFCDFQQVQRYFQLQFTGENDAYEEHSWRYSTKCIDNETSSMTQQKAEFKRWMQDILLNILLPSQKKRADNQVMRATKAINLSMFFQLGSFWHSCYHEARREQTSMTASTQSIVWHAEIVSEVLRTGALKTAWAHHPLPQNTHPLNKDIRQLRAHERQKKVDLNFARMEMAVLCSMFRNPAQVMLKSAGQPKKQTSKKLSLYATPLSLNEILRVRISKLDFLPLGMMHNPTDMILGIAIVRLQPENTGYSKYYHGTHGVIDIREALETGYSKYDSPTIGLDLMSFLNSHNGDRFPVKVLHLVSTFWLDFKNSALEVLLPKTEFTQLIEDPGIHVIIFGYNNWLACSRATALSTKNSLFSDTSLAFGEETEWRSSL